MNLKGDINNNGKIDNDKEERANIEYNAKDIKQIQSEIIKMKRKINVGGASSKSNEFASSAKLAEELTDGKQKIFFNNVNKSVVFKNGMKPSTSCVQIGTNDNSIKNVSHIHFNMGSTIRGLVDTVSQMPLNHDENKYYAPTLNLIQTLYDPTFQGIIGNVAEISRRTRDITYNEEEEETEISHDLVVDGEIKSNWLNNEFAKYALVGHNHDSTYAPLVHSHEFADIYKQTTRTIMNETTNEEEEITETKTLQEVLTEMTENLITAINGKANISHQHEFADIYKQTTRTIMNETTNEEEEITETKTLQQVLNEYEQSMTNTINQGLNNKANVSHTHEISNIYKNIDDGQGNITQKPLETLINEKDSALRALINGKANSSHTHNATEIIYKQASGNDAAVNVKKAIDDINEQLDIKDENGHKIDILAAIFGTTTGVGAVIDGGLVAAVGTLQEEVALLQTQVATLATSDLTNDVLDVVNSAGEVVEGGASVWKGLKGIANAWKQMRTAAAGYVNLSNAAAIPLMPL